MVAGPGFREQRLKPGKDTEEYVIDKKHPVDLRTATAGRTKQQKQKWFEDFQRTLGAEFNLKQFCFPKLASADLERSCRALTCLIMFFQA